MAINRNNMQTDAIRRVTFLNDPIVNPDTGIYYTLAQDNKGFQFQVALDALSPGTTDSQLTQGNQWFVENKTGLWRPTTWCGMQNEQGLPVTPTTSGTTTITTTAISRNIGKIVLAGHSYTDMLSDLATSYPDQSLFYKISSSLGVEPSNINYYGRSGALLQRANGIYASVASGSYAIGGYATILQRLDHTKPLYPGSIFTPALTSDNGLCIGIWGINDVSFYGTNAKNLEAFGNALRTVISRFRTSTVWESNDAIVTPTGSTTFVYDSNYSSGDGYTQLNNTSSGASIVLPSGMNTVASGGHVAVGFVGSNGSFAGGTADIYYGGVKVASVNTVDTTEVAYFDSGVQNRVGIVARFPLPVAGAANDTITIDVTSVQTSVDFNYVQIETPYPNTIVIPTIAKLPSYILAGSDEAVDLYNSQIQSIASEFTDVLVPDWSNSFMDSGLYANGIGDGTHPNEIGASLLAKSIYDVLLVSGTNYYNFTSAQFNSANSLPVSPIAPILNSTSFAQNAGYGSWLKQDYVTPATTVFLGTFSNNSSSITGIEQSTREIYPYQRIKGTNILGDTWITSTGSTWQDDGITISKNSTNLATNGTLVAYGLQFAKYQNYVFYNPVVIPEPCTLYGLAVSTNVGAGSGTGTEMTMGIYWDHNGQPQELLAETQHTTIAKATGTSFTTNVLSFATPLKIEVPGLYWIATCVINGTSSGGNVGEGYCAAVKGNDPRLGSSFLFGRLPYGISTGNVCYLQFGPTPSWLGSDRNATIQSLVHDVSPASNIITKNSEGWGSIQTWPIGPEVIVIVESVP